ncbi:MAG TPA: LacI family DNA-binding transcriptional regulator [Paracoccaceae bacterium]|nr:LacI family DNA-binding transcriptional regulator [Paracoccaceae bacterium]
MAARPTISDLARAAGVSVATVDRVLNGRHPVREETARRVYEAAHAIGYHATALIRQRLQEDLPRFKLGFVLQKERHEFYQNFGREAQEAVRTAAGIRGEARVHYLTTQSPGEMAEEISAAAVRCQAVAVTAIDHHLVTQAVQAAKAQGVPVFSLLNDFAQGVRESYVGLNNIKVGRTAAWMIAKGAKRPGKVAIFVGGHRWHGHQLRETGFRSYFREYAPEFTVLDTLVNLETRQLTYEATLDLLTRHPDIAGFYCAGGGMEGAITALREESRAGRLEVVVNELTSESRLGLSERLVSLVIGTPLAQLCRQLVALMVAAIRNGPSGTPGQLFLPFDLFSSESI